MNATEVNELCFRYAGSEKNALDGVSFSLESGKVLLVCGENGSGKSTLLRLLKRELSVTGEMRGSIRFFGRDAALMSGRESVTTVGFVSQFPEQNIVTDKVWSELAFGLESLGLSQSEIRLRVAETVGFFGFGDKFESEVSSLSGGQKQLLSIASVMAMRPRILILDEPAARLDPITAAELLQTVAKLNREIGTTVIMAEHNLSQVLEIADDILLLEDGKAVLSGEKHSVINSVPESSGFFPELPASVRLFARLGHDRRPLSVREGREFLCENYKNDIRALPKETKERGKTVLEWKNVSFKYHGTDRAVLRDFSLSLSEGEFLSLVGGNGSGKSTALGLAAGTVNGNMSGAVRVFGKKVSGYKGNGLYENLVLLPQEPQLLFSKNTVAEELSASGLSATDAPELAAFSAKHPYDLSGGYAQMLAIYKALARHPRILLLDEPSKSLDAASKASLLKKIRALTGSGVSVLAVTHDAEFAAEADRCAMLFSGENVAEGAPAEFFPKADYYTTEISRLTRGYFDGAVGVSDAEKLCRLNGGRL